jgi:leucyl-tRNA synthetase
MSVPGHAPYDYQALIDLKAKPDEVAGYGVTRDDLASVVPVSIIEVEGYSDLPALDVIEKIGIRSQNDSRLEDATKEIYAREFHSGRMKANTDGYAGLPIGKARDKVKEDLLQAGKADVMYEIMNRPVICRCGTECIVKIFEEQWFINYGDPEWKTTTSECLDRMSILPEDIRQEFEYTIGWLREKACARKSGLGTKLPWDKDWIIESLSDSVIYMAYYTIARLLKNQAIDVKQLADEVFDYVLLGEGELDQVSKASGIGRKILQSIREEFAYFYPLDSRHSGRDLVPNHLTFFIFNHVAIFPKENWPKQIVVNGSVLMEGKKMSKSFGNIIPLREAVRNYGADPLRLAMLVAAELLQDADFSIALTKALQEKLERFYTFASDVVKMDAYEEVELSLPDKWLISRLQRAIKATTEAMSRLKVREAVHHVLYTFDQDLQWYLRRCSGDESLERKKAMAMVLRIVLDARVKMLAPFAPYICEEIWEKMGEPGFVSKAEWPKHDEKRIDVTVEGTENIIESTLEDTANIAKATKMKAKNVYYYTAADWKWKVHLKALERAEAGKLSTSELMKELMADPEMKMRAKELAKFLQKCCDDLSKMAPDMRRSRLQAGFINEFDALKATEDFYKKETDAEVKVYREDDTAKYDPKNRAQLAQPYRPAIYIE